mmetsp:Transcript_34501/g.45380  ORF Transcript_34501/g.45380 Transcript_34501/m.45380 type:complete len:86 (+) Transcript_34501:1930-2187(+)
MKRQLLIAIRLCGEIDDDGTYLSGYGSEQITGEDNRMDDANLFDRVDQNVKSWNYNTSYDRTSSQRVVMETSPSFEVDEKGQKVQ